MNAPTLTPINGEVTSSKLRQTSAALTEMALELGPGGRLPRVSTLRRDLGVSLTTLSAALSELEANYVIERRPGAGLFVSRHLHQMTIGVVCSPVFFRPGTSPFWERLINGLRERTGTRNMMFRFYLALGSRHGAPVPDDLLQDVNAKRLDGVIYIGNEEAAVQWLEARGVSTVVFAGRGTYCVGFDMVAFAQQAAQALAEYSCQRVAIAIHNEIPPHDDLNQRECWVWNRLALVSSLKKQALPFDGRDIWDGNERQNQGQVLPDTRQEQGYEAARYFCGQPSHPDGVIIADDLMTRGFLAGLRHFGIQPGKDMHVVSHANAGSDTLREWQQSIVQIEFEPERLVQGLFDVLESVIQGHDVPQLTQITPRTMALSEMKSKNSRN
jgi:DNA-binding LacI/PurR family transcriptional regulator